MKWLLLIVCGLLIGAVVLWFFGPRLVKTAWLIARVAPYEQTVPDASTILVLGDSTGYGTGATAGEYSVAGRLGRDYPDYSIQNDSANGRTIGELEPIAREVAGQYELILLQIGGNDVLDGRDPAVVESELREIVQALTDNTKHLIMMSSGNVGAAPAFAGTAAAAMEARTREFRDMFVQVASTTELTYVDLFLEPENDPFIEEPERYLSLDGLHPSDAGYGFWYEQLRPVVREVLLVDGRVEEAN